MLLSLTNKNVDGRIIISRIRSSGSGEQEGFIKYVMLTGEKIFSEVCISFLLLHYLSAGVLLGPGWQESHCMVAVLKSIILVSTTDRIMASLQIANQAHAVILAGGTLQPIEEMRDRLFPWLPMDHLHFFSCGHIVPPESILPIAVSRGPSGLPFDFSYTSRSSLKMVICSSHVQTVLN